MVVLTCFVAVVALTAGSCSWVRGVTGSLTGSKGRVLTGRVILEEPAGLPYDFTVHLTLLDLSRGDASNAIVARYRLRPDGNTPIDFALKIDSIAVDPRHQYGIAATVNDTRGRTLWTSEGAHPVSMVEPRDVEIAMHRTEPLAPPQRKWWEGDESGG
jgi:uncharacterized lipoprotein YbaY